MKLHVLFLSLFTSQLYAAQPEAVAPVKIRNNAETNTLDIDSLSRASVKVQGATDNTSIGNTGDRLRVEGTVVQLNQVSDPNSSTTNLASNATFTGTFVDGIQFSALTVSVFSTWGGSLKFDFSSNGTTVDYTKSFTVNASNPTQLTADMGARYVRIRYVNGSSATTAFRLQTILHPFHRSSTEQRENFEPENIRGRNYVAANLSSGSTGVVYTVTPGRILRITGGNITGYNSSLLSLGVGRLDLRDGSTTVRFPVTIPGGGAPIAIPLSFPTGLRFTTNVNAVVVFGSIQYSIVFTGYEADD